MGGPQTLRAAVRRAAARTFLGAALGLVLGWGGLALLAGQVEVAEAPAPTMPEAGSAHLRGFPDRGAVQRRLSRLAQDRGCSSRGLPGGAIPASAVVAVRGTLRTVTFEQGWAVHHGRAPGRLLAVCLR